MSPALPAPFTAEVRQNKQKQKYYHEYVPDLLDVSGSYLSLCCFSVLRYFQSLQDLSETRTSQLNSIWSHVAKLESETLSRSVDHMKYLSSEIPRNDPRLDSMMFVRHNAAAWQEPVDMIFEPSPVWHDDSSMAVDETSKIFLRNILGKSKGQISELRKEEDAKRKELARAREIRKLVRAGRDKRDELEVVRGTFIVQGDLQDIERKRITAEVETSTITSVVGDISLGAQNHNFKSQTFKIPTNCDLCGERIWGLSAKGFDCRDCGYTCHSKCELKVPANCPGEQSKDEKKKLKVERQASANTAPQPQTNGGPPDGVTELPALSRSNTMNSLSSGYAASAHRSVSGAGARALTEDTKQEPQIVSSKPAAIRKNRVVAPPPMQYVSELPAGGINGSGSTSSPRSTESRGKMMYPYQASGEGEISVDEGEEVTVIEPDGKSLQVLESSKTRPECSL